MSSKHFFASTLALLMIASTASAAEVVVNSTVAEDPGVSYQTVNAALNYIKTQEEPRLVRITGGGPYTENIALNYSVTIKGDGVKPVIVAPPTAGLQNANLNGNAVSFYTTADFPGDQSFRLENLTILPAVGNAPTRALRSNNNNSGNALTAVDMKIELVDVLVTANNGSNAPVTTDGLSEANLTGATIFGDDACYFAGFVNVETSNTVISNLFGNTANTDGIIFYPDTAGYKLALGPGTVISYMNRLAVQQVLGGAILEMIGTPENPVVIKGNFKNYSVRNPAIALFGSTNPGVGQLSTMKHVVFVDNNSIALGYATVTDITKSGPPLNLDHVAFVNNKEAAFNVGSMLKEPVAFTNCTFVNNGASGVGTQAIMVISEPSSGANTGQVTFTDCVIAGNGTPGDTGTGANLIQVAAPNMQVSFVNSGLPTAGPYALGTGKFKLGTGTSAPTETNVKSEDPEFILVSSDFNNADFLDVSAATYKGAGTAGDLHGYAQYIDLAHVSDWSVY